MSDEITVRDFTREPSSYVNRLLGGESFVLTRYGRVVANLTPATTAGIVTQVEHTATDPTHRPAPEPLEVRNTGQSSYADRQPAQAARDAILGNARGRKRSE